MEPKRFQLFIDGKHFLTRGLDLACNPFNGNVLGDVVLILDNLLGKANEDEEDTVSLSRDEALDA